jgi:hypothetical protein
MALIPRLMIAEAETVGKVIARTRSGDERRDPY